MQPLLFMFICIYAHLSRAQPTRIWFVAESSAIIEPVTIDTFLNSIVILFHHHTFCPDIIPNSSIFPKFLFFTLLRPFWPCSQYNFGNGQIIKSKYSFFIFLTSLSFFYLVNIIYQNGSSYAMILQIEMLWSITIISAKILIHRYLTKIVSHGSTLGVHFT